MGGPIVFLDHDVTSFASFVVSFVVYTCGVSVCTYDEYVFYIVYDSAFWTGGDNVFYIDDDNVGSIACGSSIAPYVDDKSHHDAIPKDDNDGSSFDDIFDSTEDIGCNRCGNGGKRVRGSSMNVPTNQNPIASKVDTRCLERGKIP